MKKFAVLIIVLGAIAAGYIGYAAEDRPAGAPARMIGVDALTVDQADEPQPAVTPFPAVMAYDAAQDLQRAEAQLLAAERQKTAAELAQADADRARAEAEAQYEATRQALEAEARRLEIEATRQAQDLAAERQKAQAEAEAQATMQAQINARNEAQLQQKHDARAEERAQFFGWILLVVGAVFMAGMSAVIVAGVWRILDAVSVAKLLKVTPDGKVIALLNRDGEYSPYLVEPDQLDPVTGRFGIIPVTVNGEEREGLTVSRDSNPERTNKILVRRLAQSAINWHLINEGREDTLPGHREVNMSSAEWQRAKAILQRNGVVHSQPGVGTFYHEGWNADTIVTNLNRLNFKD